MQITTSIPGQDNLVEEVLASFTTPGTIVDIGTGSGLAARRFFEAGWEVTATGFDMHAYHKDGEGLPEGVRVLPDLDICNMSAIENASMDAVWCAHVLEHVSDTGRALAEIRRILKPDGWLFVAVPPFKHEVVGGHVNSGWNIGTLMYVLADSGFDLSEGRFVRHGYNIFGMAQRGPGVLTNGKLHRANGDLEALFKAGRFPKGFEAKQRFNGDLPAVNWKWNRAPSSIAVSRSMLASPGPVPKMRIGFFVPWITQGQGGTENVGHMMANAMVARGHKVAIFTFDKKAGPSLWPLADSIELVHLSENDDEIADQMMLVEVASRNLDLLVGLHMNRTFVRYVRCAQKVGLPIVLSEHIDPRFPDWIGTFSADERVVAFSGATLIHTLVKAFVPTLPNFLKPRVRVVPNTIREPKALAEPGKEKDVKYLLSVARLVPRKNTSRLVEAFASLASDFPGWKLRIVGSGPEESALRGQARELGVLDAVDFIGALDDPYPSYREADIFVIPSIFEGFPLTLCEALAHGVPAVGYEICNGVNEQIIHGENGFLAQGGDGVGTLPVELRKLMEDRGLREQMGRAARESYLSRFSNEVIYSAWEEMFAEAHEMGLVTSQPRNKDIAAVRLSELIWGAVEIEYSGNNSKA
ncbi:glycosyltransferase [Microbulbifer aggregans]|uniref:glycosyltransferase n=1 Tax=Microbulbifer aggregans TaxID=1769779 RepID=UPI001CFE29BA|nr:glycosyltransferase [Microbulbifer aggregans]